jgi:hypothetical protein
MHKTRPKEEAVHHELLSYTLVHPDPAFIHQNVVDAFTAQTADRDTKPIALAFALIGLYLSLEMNFSGKEVQRAHMKLGRTRKSWPRFPLPDERGEVTVSDVLAAPPGPKRDEAIRGWCASVWSAYKESHRAVAELVKAELGLLSRRDRPRR